jgi:hypothetical protein
MEIFAAIVIVQGVKRSREARTTTGLEEQAVPY